MSLPATYTQVLQFQGRQYAVPSNALTPEAAVPFSFDLAAAIAFSLTTRTDDDTGVLTVASGHGMANPDKVDLYWAVNGEPKKRVGMTVTANTATTVTVDGGTGDNLPLANSTGTVKEQQAFTLPGAITFDGDDLVCIGIDLGSEGGTLIVVDDGPGETLLAVAANGVYVWADGAGTNPLAAKTVTGIKATRASLTAGAVNGAFGLDA